MKFKLAALFLVLAGGLAAGAYVYQSAARPASDSPSASPPSAPGDNGAAAGAPAAGAGAASPIDPAAPPAVATPADPSADGALPPGFNIALHALGGRIVRASSERTDTTWAAANLIDGFGVQRAAGITRGSLGWEANARTFPDEVVFAFHQDREAEIHAVVFETTTDETPQQPEHIPADVEIWVSSASADEGFTKIAAARLRKEATLQTIRFVPARARYLKLLILSNHGATATQLGEVQIIETPSAASIVADLPKNLALPALGGVVVHVTSQRSDTGLAAWLVDDAVSEEGGWASESSASGPPSYLPQDIVFAFRNDAEALIDKVVIDPTSGVRFSTKTDRATWAKLVSIEVSSESPWTGFEEVGQFTLAREPREQAFAIGRRARFVRLRVLESYGGDRTTIGEVKFIEGRADGYQSVLLRNEPPGTPRRAATTDDAAGSAENEPNNSSSQGQQIALGTRVSGTIDPAGDLDVYTFDVPPAQRSVLSVELAGEPYVRTSLTLLDSNAGVQRVFDPLGAALPVARFSWLVSPGSHAVRVAEPPSSQVFIWDDSGSMEGRTDDLKRAVEMYLDQVRPTERLNLIRFSDGVDVLLPEFTSDRERLKAVTTDKFRAFGSTSLFDAIAKGTSLLEGVSGNRAIIVMTDGEDTASRMHAPAFWRLLRDKRILLYTIGLGSGLRTFGPKIGSTGERVLGHAALATGGRFFFVERSEQLQTVYQQIADELHSTTKYALTLSAGRGEGTLSVLATGERLASVAAPSQVEIILDASGSMKRSIGGRPMIDIAKDILAKVVQGLPDDTQVALRAYGHRVREGQRGACEDSELLVPFGRVNKARLLSKARALNALGTTPIAHSLRQVAADFGKTPGPKMVVLITDGKEECGGDVEAAAAALRDAGLDVRLNVVGFALADAAVKATMTRLANGSNGQFFDAANAPALERALAQALAVPFDVVDSAAQVVASGTTGGAEVRLPEGVYTLRVMAAGEPIRIEDVEIKVNEKTTVALKKEGQRVGWKLTRE